MKGGVCWQKYWVQQINTDNIAILICKPVRLSDLVLYVVALQRRDLQAVNSGKGKDEALEIR